jgi:hypothetical protein
MALQDTRNAASAGWFAGRRGAAGSAPTHRAASGRGLHRRNEASTGKPVIAIGKVLAIVDLNRLALAAQRDVAG